MNELEKNLNDLAIRIFQFASKFLLLNKELEIILDDYRFNLSKTKSIIGLSTTSAAIIDNRDLEPSVWVGINSDGLFSLVPDDASKKTSKGHCHFRPFGILEPLSAKAARLDITKAFPLICELANTKCRLNELNEKYRKLKESLVSVA